MIASTVYTTEREKKEDFYRRFVRQNHFFLHLPFREMFQEIYENILRRHCIDFELTAHCPLAHFMLNSDCMIHKSYKQNVCYQHNLQLDRIGNTRFQLARS